MKPRSMKICNYGRNCDNNQVMEEVVDKFEVMEEIAVENEVLEEVEDTDEYMNDVLEQPIESNTGCKVIC